MKIVKLLYLLGALLPLFHPCAGQNNPPQLKDIQVVTDTVARQITITYSVADKEEKKLRISLKASADRGETYGLTTSTASGDLGFPVLTGKRKKIVWPYDSRLVKLTDLRIKLIADDLVKVDVATLVDQVDSNRIASTMAAIYGQRSHLTPQGLARLATVKDFIDKTFTDTGLEVSRQPFKFSKFEASNLFVKQAGLIDEAKTFIVCSYYNSSSAESFGADASASGMAGVLEAMRILTKYNFAHSLLFLALDDIDEIESRGSAEFVYKGGIKETDQVQGAICLDGIGHYSNEANSQILPSGIAEVFPQVFETVKSNRFRGDFALSISNESSNPFTNRFMSVAAKLVPDLKIQSMVVPGNAETMAALAEGDHVAFWYGKIPALELSDGGITRKKDLVYDKIEDISYTFVSTVVKSVVAALADMAEPQHSTAVVSGVTMKP
ncbi:M28 family peptidase [Fibrella aquatilis]|uniref:M28 family peptidase n=1 Tax=Fibrella aquatilis TaxID=2817059 RepID=A0A939GB25_9BACT|nr:M28 family peptidase [Fibrella aquatilis]MBO0933585.1 M28 family peptidase [Fibrella aquatilis]